MKRIMLMSLLWCCTVGKTVMMAVADVPLDGIMQRDTNHCEAAATGGTRKTEPRKGFDIVNATR